MTFRSIRRPLPLILLLVFPLFFFGGPDYYSPRLLQELWNFGHFVYFFLFTALLDNYWCSKRQSVFLRVTASFFILLFVGLGTELIQSGIAGRSFTWSDIFRDLSGGGVFLFWRISTSVPSIQSVLYKIVSISILFVCLIPLGEMALDEYRERKDFPLLAGFENRYELNRWGGNAELSQSTFVSRQGNYSGKIRLTLDQYSGIFLSHFPGDWSRTDGLVFSIFNPGPKIELHYRVHDNAHRGDMQMYTNRFNGQKVLNTGWNEITIPIRDILSAPKERTMDLTQIRGFGIFVIKQNDRRVLYIDNVRLF